MPKPTKPAFGRTGIIDPPWPYRAVETDAAQGYSVGHYKSLDLDALAALPVGDLMNYGFLWCVTPMLEEAYALVRAWKMQPVTAMYWLKIDSVTKEMTDLQAFDDPGAEKVDGNRPVDGVKLFKPQYGVGYWFRGCIEPIIVFKKPGVPSLRVHEIGLISPNGAHSRKPDSLHKMIESPELPFSNGPGMLIELFARRQRERWLCLGNEIDGLDIRESTAALVEQDKAAAAA